MKGDKRDLYSNIRLSSGSKKRLSVYRKELSRDRDKVIFDDRLLAVLQTYVRDKNNLEDVRHYLNNCLDANGYQFCQSIKEYSQVKEQVLKFAEEDYTSFRWNANYQKALKEMREYFSQFSLRMLSYSSDDDIVNTLPKKTTHSGWTYIVSGSKKKGDNLDNVHLNYCKEVQSAKKIGSFNKPILIGIRTQCSGAFRDDGTATYSCKHKTRVVSMVDMFQIIAELQFAKPFQDMMMNYGRYVGGMDDMSIHDRIMGMRGKYPYYLSLDYSKYDQSISSWLIEDAFSIIKASFVMDGFDECLWDIVVRDFIYKIFVDADSIVESSKGVPSGSMFTQIIDSIVNELMIRTAMIALECPGYDMLIMGDDNLIYHYNEIDKSDLASYLIKNFGIKVNVDKTSQGESFDAPEFLSREWRISGPYRHPNILISKLLYPERFRDYSINSPLLVLYSYYLAYMPAMRDLIDVDRFIYDLKYELQNLDVKEIHFESGYIRYDIEYNRNVKRLNSSVVILN